MIGTGNLGIIGHAGAGAIAAAGMHDGVGVIRAIAPKAELLRDPRLLGKLEAPLARTMPAGLSMRVDRLGTRVLTVNIHMAVPGGVDLLAKNENISALRDVAQFVNSSDADVVMVQELRNRSVHQATSGGGLSDVASTFAHLINARHMAFTPAITGEASGFSHYGTGIFTRNGYAIDHAVNVALPNSGVEEARSAGIAAISSPDGRKPLTVISTHLASRPVEDQALRDSQLGVLADIVQSITSTGGFSYRDALSGQLQVASGYSRRIVLGGDLNQAQHETDRILNTAGLTHVNDQLARQGVAQAARAATADVITSVGPLGAHRIDHVYTSNAQVSDVAIASVPGREYVGEPTDHKSLIADLVD
ncbi:MAG: hypothetical protein H7123_08005 [Thermoleophilia bacterium]|nr:hypothetical protein [Thermoleophilia bacterium]